MISRTFTQHGQAYGNAPGCVTAKINNVVVFSGPVATENTPIPFLPNTELDIGVDIFSWQEPIDFSGTCELEIAVTGSTLLITTASADYVDFSDPTVTGPFYQVTIDEVVYTDPFTNEKINGNIVTGPYNPKLPGQWYWKVDPGSTFAATVNINPGVVPAPPEESTP
jgi:hypothetical protein